ncbi:MULTISPECIES: Uma2 family endonuclease [Kitasatospora]|uniref:Uma2 family endonuclease n=1 Tax=Kitasatospora TaxID=2063 RepID=UPI000C6FED61|nr:Uma2 family endonuclease [Kitasatospora sp. GP30]MDH6143798.1 Uma2 family endonuclease [Kitasatospora sp. GP30]
MTAETVASHRPAPDWMHQPITAAEYDSLPEELCADIEIVDGMVVMSPSATPRHNRIARLLANALDTASPAEWFADSDFDVRLQDIPLTNRCPDIVVYQADKIDARPMRPQYILLVVEVVSPGSETTDRVFKPLQYAQAGIRYYWRVEQVTGPEPKVFTYELDPETMSYRATEVFTGLVKATAPFQIDVDLTGL